MGGPLSKPVTKKESHDQVSRSVCVGSSSMQGWGFKQEDAHNVITDYDQDTSLFAVYDGHNGHEVATYCAQQLPQFIIGSELYKQGNLSLALENSFLDFDATLTTKEVIKAMKEIAGIKSEEDKFVHEIRMFVRPKEYDEAGGPSESKGSGVIFRRATSLPNLPEHVSDEIAYGGKEDDIGTGGPGFWYQGGDIMTSPSPPSFWDNYGEESKSNDDLMSGSNIADDSGAADGEIEGHFQGMGESKGQSGEPTTTPSPSSQTIKETSTSPTRQSAGQSKHVTQEFSNGGQNGDVGGSGDAKCEEDRASSSKRQGEESPLSSNFLKWKPGRHSGCTAVVALLRGNDLFVANAGDSRCVMSCEGKAVDMTRDHKPVDDLERKRIILAGGRVTSKGRVNGVLNLSRAIGDHRFKQNEELSAREQMVTALPDVRTYTINPQKDEFMVLVSDGVWKAMTSQEVVDFVRTRLQTPGIKLSTICEQILDNCLNQENRDDMTAIIVQFLGVEENGGGVKGEGDDDDANGEARGGGGGEKKIARE